MYKSGKSEIAFIYETFLRMIAQLVTTVIIRLQTRHGLKRYNLVYNELEGAIITSTSEHT